MCAHGQRPPQFVVLLEERERISAGYNACALVVQERRRASLEDRDIVSVPLKCYACCKAA
jgi:hypothetical protein